MPFTPRNKLRSRKGATAVEFAIVSPFLFLTLMVGFEFVRVNLIRQTAENAAFRASRAVMVPGATRAEAIAEAESVMSMAGVNTITVEFTPETITENTPFVTTRITVPMNENSWGLSLLFRDSNISAESRLRTERVPSLQAQALPTILNPPPPPPPPPSPPPTPVYEPNPELDDDGDDDEEADDDTTQPTVTEPDPPPEPEPVPPPPPPVLL